MYLVLTQYLSGTWYILGTDLVITWYIPDIYLISICLFGTGKFQLVVR